MRGVRRATAARHRARRDPRASAPRPDPLRRAGLRLRRGSAQAQRRAARPGRPGARHLLRHAGHGARARRAGGGRRGGRVRPLAPDRVRAGPPARRAAERAELLDEPPRHRVRGAARLHRAGGLDRVARRRAREPRARAVRDPVPPRGRAHALRHPDPRDLPAGHLRAIDGLERRLDRRGADRANPGPGGRRQGDLRPLGRGRLERGRPAHLQGGRRPAHVRVHRPRPDAQERGRAGREGVPRRVQGPAGGRGRRGALPRPSWRA